MKSASLVTVLTALLVTASNLSATDDWIEADPAEPFDLADVTTVQLSPVNSQPRTSFFIAGQFGIWRGDLPLAGAWEQVLNEQGVHYRAIVGRQLQGAPRNVVEAVGDSGQVASSIDGEPGSWTSSTIAGAGNFTGLAVRTGGLIPLVAVDDAGNIYSGGSVGGLGLRHAESDVVWHDVAFGANTWVAVGSGATAATSTDGMTWQIHTSALMDGQVPVDFHGVDFGTATYRGGFFTAVGEEGAISTSLDGINWTVRETASGSSRLLRGVCFSARHAAWLAFGDGGVGRISLNGGRDWGNINRVFPQGMNSVAFGHGFSVVVGDNGNVFSSITRLNPSLNNLTVPPEGGSTSITLTNSSSVAQWRASVVSGAEFISVVPSQGSGTFPNAFTITVDAFETITNRSGAVLVNDIAIAIAQTGDGDPLPATDLIATALTDAAIELDWIRSEENGATHYEIQRRHTSNVDFTPVATVEDQQNQQNSNNRMTFVDRFQLLPNSEYCYQVVALNVGRQLLPPGPAGSQLIACNDGPCNRSGEPPSLPVEFGRADPSPPDCATTLLSGARDFTLEVVGELEGIQLNWTPVPGASSYTLRRDDGTGLILIGNPLGEDTEYFDSNFPGGLAYFRTYTYELTAVSPGGAVPEIREIFTGIAPVISASVRAVDIDDIDLGFISLQGAFELSFSRRDGLGAEVESRVEPGGAWRPIGRSRRYNLLQPTRHLEVVSDVHSGGVRTETWLYRQPPAVRSFRFRATSGMQGSTWFEIGPASTPPPPDPAGFVVADRTSNSGTFAWGDVSGETGYEITVRPSSAIDDSQDIAVSFARDSESGTVSGLFPGTSYDAFLVAAGVEGRNATSRSTQGAASATLTFSTLRPGPFPVIASASAPTNVHVSWERIDGASSYQIWRSDFFAGSFQPYVLLDTIQVSRLSPSKNDGSVTGSKSYRYQVRAKLGEEFTSFRESNIVNTPLGVPAIESVRALSSTSILIDWQDGNPSSSGFTIERALSASGPWAIAGRVSGTLLSPPPRTFTDTGLLPTTLYFYRVSASGFFGINSEPSASDSAVTFSPLRVTGIRTNDVTLNWNLTKGIDNYIINRSDTGKDGSYKEVGSAPHPAEKFSDTGLSPSTVYHYQMVPKLSNGGLGDGSEIVRAVTKPLSPIGLTAEIAASGSPQIELNWQAGSVSDEYTIQWRPAGGAFMTIGTNLQSGAIPPATSSAHGGIHPGVNSYQVRASFMDETSAFSTAVEVTYQASFAEQWRFDHFGTIQNVRDAHDRADPDGDGFENAIERTAGSDPNDPANVPAPSEEAPGLTASFADAFDDGSITSNPKGGGGWKVNGGGLGSFPQQELDGALQLFPVADNAFDWIGQWYAPNSADGVMPLGDTDSTFTFEWVVSDFEVTGLRTNGGTDYFVYLSVISSDVNRNSERQVLWSHDDGGVEIRLAIDRDGAESTSISATMVVADETNQASSSSNLVSAFPGVIFDSSFIGEAAGVWSDRRLNVRLTLHEQGGGTYDFRLLITNSRGEVGLDQSGDLNVGPEFSAGGYPSFGAQRVEDGNGSVRFEDVTVLRKPDHGGALLTGRAWQDLNGDNVAGRGESGLPGVGIEVISSLGKSTTFQTDSNGYFRIPVSPDTYTLHFDAPDGYSFVEKNIGADELADSDVDPESGGDLKVVVGDVSHVTLGLRRTGFRPKVESEGTLAYDGFDYAEGKSLRDADLNGGEGSFWGSPWRHRIINGFFTDAMIHTSGLSDFRLPLPLGNSLLVPLGTSERDFNKAFGEDDSEIFVSFLIRNNSQFFPGTGNTTPQKVEFRRGPNGSASIAAQAGLQQGYFVEADPQGANKQLRVFSRFDGAKRQRLFVMRFSFGSDGADSIDTWMDPEEETDFSLASNRVFGSDLSFDKIALNAGHNAGFLFDEFRIGTRPEDVFADQYLLPVTSISGRVWNDTDGDGKLDDDESGIEGEKLRLNLGDGEGTREVVTTVGGGFVFDQLPKGEGEAELDAPEGVGGSVAIDTVGRGAVDLTGMSVDGGLVVTGSGTDRISGKVASGTTRVRLEGPYSHTRIVVPGGAFPRDNEFMVEGLSEEALEALPREAGAPDGGKPLLAEPILGITAEFGEDTAKEPVILEFQITLQDIGSPQREALVAAATKGELTIIGKADADGAPLKPMAVVSGNELMYPDEGVRVTARRADGSATTDFTRAKSLHLTALVTHFSIYAVAIVPGQEPFSDEGFQIAAELLNRSLVMERVEENGGGGNSTVLRWAIVPIAESAEGKAIYANYQVQISRDLITWEDADELISIAPGESIEQLEVTLSESPDESLFGRVIIRAGF